MSHSVQKLQPLGEHSVLAGKETGAPFVDAEVALAGKPRKFSKAGTTTPVKNYRQLGLNPHAKFFNAGVLVINVGQWRQRNVPLGRWASPGNSYSLDSSRATQLAHRSRLGRSSLAPLAIRFPQALLAGCLT